MKRNDRGKRSMLFWAAVLALIVLVVWLVYAGFGGPDDTEYDDQIILDESSRVG